MYKGFINYTAHSPLPLVHAVLTAPPQAPSQAEKFVGTVTPNKVPPLHTGSSMGPAAERVLASPASKARLSRPLPGRLQRNAHRCPDRLVGTRHKSACTLGVSARASRGCDCSESRTRQCCPSGAVHRDCRPSSVSSSSETPRPHRSSRGSGGKGRARGQR